MQIQDPPRRPAPRETYTPGHTANATAFMSARTLDSHGGFVLPLLESGLEILDAGCGPGTITHGLAEAALPGRVTGIDAAQSQISRAEWIAQGRELTNARFVCASVYALPFPAASFDLVFSHALFEHLAAPAGALREFKRVLRPGGLAALCSPDWEAFEITPSAPEATNAIREYRRLQERNGGNTRAGGMLTSWLADEGFGILSEGERFENYESSRRIGEYLAVQLHTDGKHRAAEALLEWSALPGAQLRGCWKHAIAIRWNQ